MRNASVMLFKPTFVRWAASQTKLAECLASGLPVIINKSIWDTEEVIQRNKVGVVLDTFSEHAYRSAVRVGLPLLQEPDIRARCRAVAQTYFSNDVGIASYKSIYYEL